MHQRKDSEKRGCDTEIGAPVSQSAAFTEFRIMQTPDQIIPQVSGYANNTLLPAIESRSVASS